MKKRIFVLISLLMGLVLLLGGCISIGGGLNSVRGSGEMVSRDFQVDNFTAINVGGIFDVTYRQSQSFSVVIEMQENLFDHLDVSVRRSTLHIDTNRNFDVGRNNTPRLYIYAPYLDEAIFRGAVNAENWDTIRTHGLIITVSGAVSVDIPVDVDQLDVTVSGAGSLDISGRADNADITMSGAGSISALDLQIRDADILVSGVGSVEVAVSGNLYAVVSGVGSIRYAGSPAVTSRITGLGSISRID